MSKCPWMVSIKLKCALSEILCIPVFKILSPALADGGELLKKGNCTMGQQNLQHSKGV